jgi:hypothetical protein
VDGTPGDSEAAWAYAVQATKDLVTAEGNTPEVGVYFGYRAFYDANDMANNDRTFLGHNPDWTGTPGSPGFLASTGFDYVDDNTPGYSASDEAYNKWFAPELAGLYSMGFDTVGLDVGAKIFLNTKGMITGGTGNNSSNPPFTTGDDRLIDLFNSYGMKPYGEAIPMETYGLNGDPLTGDNAEAYTDMAYMGYWKNSVGYSGLDENGGSLVIGANITIHNPTAGDGTATVGPNANTWDPNTTEIHCVFRWNNSGDINQLIGKDGSGNSLGYGWTTMKQVLYDLHTAGMIISISGSVQSSMTDGLGYVITAAEFHQYVMDLSTGAITARPGLPAIDLMYSATVPNQTVTNTSFLVEAVADNLDPASPVTLGPQVSLNGSVLGNMTLGTMVYPTGADTSAAEDSTPVWQYTVTLPSTEGALHDITLDTTTKSISVPVKYKSALNVLQATSAADLRSKIQSSLNGAGADVDVIEITYSHVEPTDVNNSELHAVGESLGSQILNERNSWLHITLGSGGSYSHSVTTGQGAIAPDCNFLCWDGLTYGSPTDDWKGGGINTTVYPVPNDAAPQMWFKDCEYVGWMGPAAFGASLPDLDTADVSYDGAGTISSFAGPRTNNSGQTTRMFASGCVWDGTVTNVRYSGWELVRDDIGDHTRGDYANGYGCYLNHTEYGYPSMYRSDDGSLRFHNDLYQMFGGGDSGAYIGGTKVVGDVTRDGNPGLPHDGQKFLFDSTQATDGWYENVMLRDMKITGPAKAIGTTNCQWSGKMRNTCFRDILNTGQRGDFRTDTVPVEALLPSNGREPLQFGADVYIHNVTLGSTAVSAPQPGAGSRPADPPAPVGEVSGFSSAGDITAALTKVFVDRDAGGGTAGIPTITNYVVDQTLTIDTGGTTAWGEGNVDGVWKVENFASSPNLADNTEVITSTNYPATGGPSASFSGWFNSGNNVGTRYWTIGASAPFIAVWNETGKYWLTNYGTGSGNGSTNETVVYDLAQTANGINGQTLIIVLLTTAPTQYGDWTAYDGPTS